MTLKSSELLTIERSKYPCLIVGKDGEVVDDVPHRDISSGVMLWECCSIPRNLQS